MRKQSPHAGLHVPSWLPYIGLLFAGWALYSAYVIISATEPVSVPCSSGRTKELCLLIFGNLERTLDAHTTNLIYAAVFFGLSLFLALLSLRRLKRRSSPA
jgi:hypothetical protein